MSGIADNQTMLHHPARMLQVAGSALLLVVCATVASSCAGDTGGSAQPAEDGAQPAEEGAASAVANGDRCLLVLHGKGGEGGESYVENDATKIFPAGNASAESWGGRQWLYFPQEKYEEARSIVVDAVDGCGQVIIGGFSNGAAFTAAMYCNGETLDGRLTGVVIDDPVPDHSADDCEPDPNVDVTVYWTGAMVEAEPGWKCAEADWTCDGGETIGIDAYTQLLRVEKKASPYTDHQWYYEAPELSAWR